MKNRVGWTPGEVRGPILSGFRSGAGRVPWSAGPGLTPPGVCCLAPGPPEDRDLYKVFNSASRCFKQQPGQSHPAAFISEEEEEEEEGDDDDDEGASRRHMLEHMLEKCFHTSACT